MRRRPPRSTRMTHSFPTRRSSDLKARTVADRLRKMPGIVEAEASAVGAISVEFSRSELTEAEIRKALAQMSVRPRQEVGADSATAATKAHEHAEHDRTEGRRVGKECVSTGKTGWATDKYKKNNKK